MQDSDTIFALSTVPGKSAIAIIRVTGGQALDALEKLSSSPLPPPRHAALRKIYSGDGELIDHALVCRFAAPDSFTGEDMVELHLHGSQAVIKLCLNALGALPGFRPAEPGEFCKRAFLNGKLDLLEVEAIADVIDAETTAQLKQASRQLEGHMGNQYRDFRARIVEMLALMEAYIDFPEEDIPQDTVVQVKQGIERLAERIDNTLADRAAGERIRSGFKVALIGAPNVGKSSLLNALAGRDAAIVSPLPGTTRDVIEVHMDIGGYPVTIYDTAGIRDSTDMIESIGIDRSMASLHAADIVVFVADMEHVQETQALLLQIEDALKEKPLIFCLNKSDMLPGSFSVDDTKVIDSIYIALRALGVSTPNPPASRRPLGGDTQIFKRFGYTLFSYKLCVSAKTGQNLDRLEAMLQTILDSLAPQEVPIITQKRHRLLLEDCSAHLRRCLMHPLPLELFCEELRLAAQALGKITGSISPDEILGEIFTRFCIGK